MTPKDRERLQKDWGRRFGAVAQRVSESGEFAFAPWLQPGQTLAELRRTVQRLRSGSIRPADPQLSPLVLADVLEKTIAKEELVRWIVAELGGNNELHRSIKERRPRRRG